MSGECRVVPIAEEHIESFYAVLDTVARERRYLAFLEAPPFDGAARFVRGNIAAGNPQFIATVDDRLVGWCDIVRRDRPVFRHSGVMGIGILAEHRGRGIGRRLAGAALAAAAAAGMTRIELHVRADNARAIALYEKLGFAVEGKLRRYVHVDGQYEDGLLMAMVRET
jgi:RimJ/RimL family protein N-acetyltransferase